MAVVIFIVACCLTLTAAQLGLPCMQKDTIQEEVRKCFSGLGKSNLINLDPTDKSGTMGQVAKLIRQKGACEPDVQDHLVEGLGCYMDFYGNCLNIRKMMPSRLEIRDALGYACKHPQEMEDRCLGDVPKNMMVCYLNKVKERQIDLLTGKAHFKGLKDETCGFLKEEMKCLGTALNTEHCPPETKKVYQEFMGKMIPHACSYPEGDHRGLLDALKKSSKLGSLLMRHTKSRNPR